eukprot:2073157-Pyramimonas_sp.AAC.1
MSSLDVEAVVALDVGARACLGSGDRQTGRRSQSVADQPGGLFQDASAAIPKPKLTQVEDDRAHARRFQRLWPGRPAHGRDGSGCSLTRYPPN